MSHHCTNVRTALEAKLAQHERPCRHPIALYAAENDNPTHGPYECWVCVTCGQQNAGYAQRGVPIGHHGDSNFKETRVKISGFGFPLRHFREPTEAFLLRLMERLLTREGRITFLEHGEDGRSILGPTSEQITADAITRIWEAARAEN